MAIENQKWYEQTTKKKALRESDTATLLRYFFVQIREDCIKSRIVEIKVKSDIHCHRGIKTYMLFILLQISSRNSLKARHHKDAEETSLSWLILEISEYH
jgi:hypothetical protein